MYEESLKAYKRYLVWLILETELLKLFPTFTIYFEMYSEAWPIHIFNAEWKLSLLFLSQ